MEVRSFDTNEQYRLMRPALGGYMIESTVPKEINRLLRFDTMTILATNELGEPTRVLGFIPDEHTSNKGLKISVPLTEAEAERNRKLNESLVISFRSGERALEELES